eukprot:scaffold40339_cov68-Phaeocystis_antarctica.AAC.4
MPHSVRLWPSEEITASQPLICSAISVSLSTRCPSGKTTTVSSSWPLASAGSRSAERTIAVTAARLLSSLMRAGEPQPPVAPSSRTLGMVNRRVTRTTLR